MQEIDVQRMRAYMYQVAQALIVHDDFTLLPQAEQAGESGIRPLVLFRRKWNTMQVVRLLPADGCDLGTAHDLMEEEIPRLDYSKRQNAVQNAYSLTLFIFAHWRSDENMRSIAAHAPYAGMMRNLGAGGAAVDLARGVLGPLPEGPVMKNIDPRLFQEALEQVQGGLPEYVLERSDEHWQAYLTEVSSRRSEQIGRTVQSQRKPVGTYVLLALTILIYMIGQSYIEVIEQGLMWPEGIRQGELWRLITPVFLHYELTHIAFNMISLWAFGRLVENIFGTGRYLVIYLLAGLAGCLLSFLLGDNPSLGASGAIFGLFGALLAFGRVDRRTFSMTIGASIYGLLAVNLAIGFLLPGIDYWGHIGGLIGGYLIALAVGVPKYKTSGGRRVLTLAAFAAFALFSYWGGIGNLF